MRIQIDKIRIFQQFLVENGIDADTVCGFIFTSINLKLVNGLYTRGVP